MSSSGRTPSGSRRAVHFRDGRADRGGRSQRAELGGRVRASSAPTDPPSTCTRSPHRSSTTRATSRASSASPSTSRARRLSQVELRRVLAVAQILQDIGATLVSELDADKVMKTVTGAARKLTGASMGAFLRTDADDEAPGSSCGPARGAPASRRWVWRSPPTRRCSRRRWRARRRSASTMWRPSDEFAATLDAIMPAVDGPLRSCIVMAVRSRAGDVAGAMLVAHTAAGRFTLTDEQLLTDIAVAGGHRARHRPALPRGRGRDRGAAARRGSAAVLRRDQRGAVVVARLSRELRAARSALRAVSRRPVHDRRRRGTRRAAGGRHPRRPEQGSRSWPSSRSATHPTRTVRIPAASVLRGGAAEVAEAMSDAFLRSTTRDDRHFEIVKELDFTLVHVRPARRPRSGARRADARVVGVRAAFRSGRSRARRRVRATRRAGARQRPPLLGA